MRTRGIAKQFSSSEDLNTEIVPYRYHCTDFVELLYSRLVLVKVFLEKESFST